MFVSITFGRVCHGIHKPVPTCRSGFDTEVAILSGTKFTRASHSNDAIAGTQVPFAGLARPSGVTFTTWFRRQQPRIETCPETPLAVTEFLQLADWAAYGVDDLKTAMING
jgi:hypothetical protein